eukprot:538895-Prorocentrum_minimum.AAC.1
MWRGSGGGLEGIDRSSLDARKPQNPTKSEEYQGIFRESAAEPMACGEGASVRSGSQWHAGGEGASVRSGSQWHAGREH